MCYAHVVDNNWLPPIWSELAVYVRDDFRTTLEGACRAIARLLHLALLVITHGLADMVREVCFYTHDYASLMVGAIEFFSVAHMAAAGEKLSNKASIWDNALRGNVRPSMAELSQLLAVNSGQHQVDWFTEEAASEGKTSLLDNL